MIQWFRHLLRQILPGAPPRHVRSMLTKLGLRTRNFALYQQALRHVSGARYPISRGDQSYERLEFLGDAVLDCAVAEHLYHAFPQEPEGFLTPLRAKLVSKSACARVARTLDLGTFIQLSDEFERYGGRDNDSVLADCLEALIGAIYVDKGMQHAYAFVYEHMLKPVDLHVLATQESNFKSLLQENAQARGLELPAYTVVDISGAARNQIFTVEVELDGHRLGIGRGNTKKNAEQRAAQEALAKIRSEV